MNIGRNRTPQDQTSSSSSSPDLADALPVATRPAKKVTCQDCKADEEESIDVESLLYTLFPREWFPRQLDRCAGKMAHQGTCSSPASARRTLTTVRNLAQIGTVKWLRITVCGACEGTGILGYLMRLGQSCFMVGLMLHAHRC